MEVTTLWIIIQPEEILPRAQRTLGHQPCSHITTLDTFLRTRGCTLPIGSGTSDDILFLVAVSVLFCLCIWYACLALFTRLLSVLACIATVRDAAQAPLLTTITIITITIVAIIIIAVTITAALQVLRRSVFPAGPTWTSAGVCCLAPTSSHAPTRGSVAQP